MALQDGHDDLRCHVCFDIYKHPKRMPSCSHSFCLECLHKLVAVSQQRDTLLCPECRQEQSLDDPDGVDEYDTDTELNDQVDELSCADCKKSCKTHLCQNCLSYCCKDCVKIHKDNICPVLERLRKLEREIPSSFSDDRVRRLESEWAGYKKSLPEKRTQTVKKIDRLIEALNEKKRYVLSQLTSEKAISDKMIDNLSTIKKSPQIINGLRDKLRRDSDNKAFASVVYETDRIDSILVDSPEMLTCPPKINLREEALLKDIEKFGQLIRYRNIDYSTRSCLRRVIYSDVSRPTWDVAVCPLTGNICATEKNHVRIHNAQGDVIGRFATGTFPARLTVNRRGQIIVAHFREHTVKTYDQEGTVVHQFGACGSGKGQFRGPRAVYCDPRDRLLIADMHNHNISVHDSSGKFLTSFGENVLAEPLGVAVNSKGQIFVSDTHNNAVYSFDEKGAVLRRAWRAGDREIEEPMGIYVDDQDNVLLCNNAEEKRVEIYDSNLIHIGSIADPERPFNFLLGVAITDDKDILISEYNSKDIKIF